MEVTILALGSDKLGKRKSYYHEIAQIAVQYLSS